MSYHIIGKYLELSVSSGPYGLAQREYFIIHMPTYWFLSAVNPIKNNYERCDIMVALNSELVYRIDFSRLLNSSRVLNLIMILDDTQRDDSASDTIRARIPIKFYTIIPSRSIILIS